MITQYGTIPFMRGDQGPQVVLITSASGCWIFPKGRYEEELGKHGTAEMETFEEAGVKGRLYRKPVYRARVFIKSGERVRLILYPLEVGEVHDDWPEKYRRERRIVSLDEARALIESQGLRSCMEHFIRDFLF